MIRYRFFRQNLLFTERPHKFSSNPYLDTMDSSIPIYGPVVGSGIAAQAVVGYIGGIGGQGYIIDIVGDGDASSGLDCPELEIQGRLRLEYLTGPITDVTGGDCFTRSDC